ncbi:MAG TPA: S8 family serine peptidase [Candidatus Acidoferrales bacterium]|nr:S8 family serine peptidase [Candidatus Acidoferrales bacterium]
MKPRILILIAALICIGFLTPTPAASATNRYIVVSNGGLTSVLNLCNLLGCQVQGSLDGNIGQTFLVTSNNLLSPVISLVESLLGIVSIEADRLLPIPQIKLASTPSGLYDMSPVNFYGTVAWQGYALQPAAQIIHAADARAGYGVTGSGVLVADIDTGVDPNHPVLQPVLLQGYDFTRNQPGASEWLDVSQLQSGMVDTDTQDQAPVEVQQSTAAVLDQSTAAVLDGSPYVAFGHGTMTAGLIHLVAPKARILPLKAFSANGTGYVSNIVAALYFAIQNKANVVNMSFDLSTPSSALSKAVASANRAGLILVASAGNEDTSNAVYPAALKGNVIGIASTSNSDTRSSFSNYGSTDVWIAAPGESVVSTYPGGTYGSSSGTSFSSPLVTGSAALLMSAKSGLSQSNAASALSHAQVLTSDLNHGRLNVAWAVSAWLNSW